MSIDLPESAVPPPAGSGESSSAPSRRTFIAAVALHIRGGVIREAKVAAGGVGTVPWKLPAVERALIDRRPSDALWTAAAEKAAEGARPLTHNRFKAALLRRTVERQLRVVGGTK